MYVFSVFLMAIAFPVLSIVTNYNNSPEDGLIFLIGKWFVFWGAGVRLLAAGVWQLARPAFTASGIFGIKDPSAEKIVTELGLANIAIGLTSIVSLIYPSWIAPAGFSGSLFLLAAGVKHAFNTNRGIRENVAMTTDIIISVMIIIYLISTVAEQWFR